MALHVRRSAVIRVAFLTDSRFAAENAEKLGALKKRALRVVMQRQRCPVIEDSNNPDVVFEIRRLAGSKSWYLHRRSYYV